MDRYKIVRYSKKGSKRVVERNLTLDEARRYCQRDDTKGEGWFCGFTKQ